MFSKSNSRRSALWYERFEESAVDQPEGQQQLVKLFFAVPADGVKGKTWGPSTCHQRERSQIPLLRPAPRPGGVWSKSAPNLDKSRIVLTRPPHDIGKPITPPPRVLNQSVGVNTASTKTVNVPTSKLLVNKFVSAFNLSDFKPFRCTGRNNSYPNNASQLKQTLSRSIGNITESHYDTVFTTNSFVIARGVSNNNCLDFDQDFVDVEEPDTEKLLKE